MTDATTAARAFAELHVKGRPLILFNAWDAGSAKAIAAAGAPAIATGSWSVSASAGYADGEQVPLAFVLDNLRRIVGAVSLPVSLDFESGYGRTPAELDATFAQVLDAGAIGCNVEDGKPDGSGLYTPTKQAARLAALRACATRAGIAAFINARTDIFLVAPPESHDAAMLADVIARGRAYADAGASGLFAPGLVDEAMIAELCAASTLPVNIMASAKTPPVATLARLGVARLSYGPGPYVIAMKALDAAAREVYGTR